MRRLSIERYEVENPDGTSTPYDVDVSLLALLDHPGRQRDARQVMVSAVVRGKIIEAVRGEDAEVLLEEAEYQDLADALATAKGLTTADVGLVERIQSAETVEVRPRDVLREV